MKSSKTMDRTGVIAKNYIVLTSFINLLENIFLKNLVFCNDEQ